MKKQAGFTLIELIMVIVILGILSAFALPRFADLSGGAESAANQGVIGALRSASAIARAACLADSACATTGASTVTLEGQVFDMYDGYLSAQEGANNQVFEAAQVSGFSTSNPVNRVTAGTIAPGAVDIALNGTCVVTYTEASIAASPSVPSAAITTAGVCN